MLVGAHFERTMATGKNSRAVQKKWGKVFSFSFLAFWWFIKIVDSPSLRPPNTRRLQSQFRLVSQWEKEGIGNEETGR